MSDSNDPLSERELEILRLVATGAPNKEIAKSLVISPNTVKVHLRNIFTKIGVSTRTEATLYAIQIGLITPAMAPLEAGENGDREAAPSAGPAPGSPAAEGALAGAVGVPAQAPAPAAGGRLYRGRFLVVGIVLVLAAAAMLVRFWGGEGLRPLAPTGAPAAVPSDASPTNRWAGKAPLPEPRKGMAALEYESTFLVIGGETRAGVDGAVLRYSLEQDQWETLVQKPTPVSGIQGVVLGGQVYVPGGRLANGQVTGVLEVYDPRENRWEARAPLPGPASQYAAAPFEGRLYLFGGTDGKKALPDVWIYDPEADRWEPGEPMPQARAQLGAVASGGKIYVIGGFDGKQAYATNAAFDPSRDSQGESAWENLPPMPDARYAMGVTSLAGFVYVVGGRGAEPWSATLPDLLYLPGQNQWVAFDPPPTPIGEAVGLIPSSGFLYVLGGETSAGIRADHQAYQAIYTITVPLQRKDAP